MRLVQKKCPNCGAAIDFDDMTKKVKCAYCGQTFYVEKDNEKINNDVDIDKHIEDAFKLVNNVKAPFAGIFVLVFFMIIVVFIITFVNVFNFNSRINIEHDNFEVIEKEENPNLIVDFNQIDDKTLNDFHNDAIKSLDKYMFKSSKVKIVKNWSNVGMYLIVDYTFEDTDLVDVFDIIYSVNGKEYHLYSAVTYNRLELSDNGVVVSSFDGMVSSPSYILDLDNSNRVFLNGYESIEELFNKEIRSYMTSDYSIKSTDGLYMIKG